MVWRGFPGGNSGKAPICQCRRRKRCGFHPWVGKIYWRSTWPPTPVFMPGEYAQTEEPDRLQIHRVTKSGSQLKHNMSSQTHRLKPQPPMWLSLETGLLRRGLILNMAIKFSSVQFSPSAVSNSLRPMECSTPGLPVHHQLLEFTQTHVLWVGDAIQPSYPLSSPSPPALILSQHQGLFKWVSSSHQVARVLEFQLQHQSFQRIFRTDFL